MEINEIKTKLNVAAKKISKELNNAPVIVIVAGSEKANVRRCILGHSHLNDNREGRLRDIVGILETAKDIEVLDHFS